MAPTNSVLAYSLLIVDHGAMSSGVNLPCFIILLKLIRERKRFSHIASARQKREQNYYFV